MRSQKKRFIILLGLIFVIAIISMGASSCPAILGDPAHYLVIENQTQQTLTIYYSYGEIGKAVPGGNVTASMGISVSEGIIAAKNARGELIFLRRYTSEDYKNIGNFYYKAVIPPDIPLMGLAYIDVSISNKTEIEFSIIVNDNQIGKVGAYENVTKTIPVDWDHYVISAKDSQGQTAFTKKFTFLTMQEFKSQDLKVVITIPYVQITFLNDTDTILDVYVNYFNVGNIKPGETVIKTIPWYNTNNIFNVLIRAMDSQGDVVFSKMYSNNVSTELVKMGWKVVLRPLIE
jgi:hypothetical protein